jgi:hypothetical protein
MTDMDYKACLTVRVTVKLRPDEYDELFRHVRRIGSTMSAFLRESAAKAIEEGRPSLSAVSRDPDSAQLVIATAWPTQSRVESASVAITDVG